MVELENAADDANKMGIARFLLTPVFIILDLGTDTYSVFIYWNNKESLNAGLEVAIFATISLILGYLIGLICLIIFVGGKQGTENISDWKKKIKNEIAIARVGEATFETLPQLWISLYTLAVGLQQQDIERGMLYFSTVTSWISISLVLSNFDEVLLEDDAERKVTVSAVEKLLLGGCKSVMLLSRMLLIVFMTFRISWWTALFIGLHFVLVVIILAYRFQKTLLHTLLLSIFSVFSWLSGEDSMQYESLMLFVFVTGHTVGFAVCSVSGNNNPFYLLPHFTEIYISISTFAVFLFLVYVMSRKCVKSTAVGPH